MKRDGEAAHALLLLRLLLDGACHPDVAEQVDWEVVRRISTRNRVLVRVADRMGQCGVALPVPLANAVRHERQRVGALLGLVHELSDACADHGIEHLFPTAFQHYPDMGSDIDLLVLTRSPEVDASILAELQAAAVKPSFCQRMSGAAVYRVRGSSTPLDIHHGRLGIAGEHTELPDILVRNRQHLDVDGVGCFVPSRNDQVVIQGMQCVYGRRAIRLADVVQSIAAVRSGGLDWEYIIATAARAHVLSGMGCYLGYVEQIHQQLYGRELLPGEVVRHLRLAGWGRVTFRDGRYRFPTMRVSSRVYAKTLWAAIAGGSWEMAGRLCLIPMVATALILTRLSADHSPAAMPAHAPVT